MKSLLKTMLTAVSFIILMSAGLNTLAQNIQPQKGQVHTLLNASYDVSRELYKDLNAAFIKSEAKLGKTIMIDQSHNGSSKQARAVIDGLEADVVTMNQSSDIVLLEKAGLIDPKWQSAFPNQSSPYSSTILFLVRKGNPKGIHDWGDLVKDGVQIVMPNPKTSGNGRYSYLGALAFAKLHFKDDRDPEAATRTFIQQIYKNTPILDAGGRGATTSFIQRQIGDVLLTFESEVFQITRQFNQGDFEVITPSLSIKADYPAAIILPVVKKHQTEALATDYLNFLFSKEGQAIIEAHYLRPYLGADTATVVETKKETTVFAPLHLVTVDELGGWDAINKTHFSDGGLFDQIYTGK